MNTVDRVKPLVNLTLDEEEARALVEALSGVPGRKGVTHLFRRALSIHEGIIKMRVQMDAKRVREAGSEPVKISCDECHSTTSDPAARFLWDTEDQCAMCLMDRHGEQQDDAGVDQGEL